MNLEAQKSEILEYLEAGGFAVFHGIAGGLEGLPLVLWDVESHPDYREFLAAAKKCGASLILVASRQFEASELDEILEQMEGCEFTRDEQRDYERRLKDMYVYDDEICSIELAFDLNSRFYVFELQTDWYDDFVSIEDDVVSRLSEDDEEKGPDESLGGFFSRN